MEERKKSKPTKARNPKTGEEVVMQLDARALRAVVVELLDHQVKNRKINKELKSQIRETIRFFKKSVVGLSIDEIRGPGVYKVTYEAKENTDIEALTLHLNQFYVIGAIATIYGHSEEFYKALIDKHQTEAKPFLDQVRKDTGEKGSSAYGIHAVQQMFGPSTPTTNMFSKQMEEFYSDTGLKRNNVPQRLGAFLNDAQMRVFEGVLKAFSDTNYRGDLQVNTNESLKESYKIDRDPAQKKLQKAYAHIDKIPVIRITQAEIIELSGFNKANQKHKKNAIDALRFLGENQYCFFWTRTAKDNKGRFIKKQGNSGDWVKEQVTEVGTFFRIKEVRHDETEAFMYYEIHPSAVVLDQVNSDYGGNYFLLVPNDWREEVKKIAGTTAKNSKYTMSLLLWLRLKFEQIRRYNANKRHKTKKPYKIEMSWEEIAQELKMPESFYVRNRKSALKKIEDAYNIAQEVGYITSWERKYNDTIYLNEDYYPQPPKKELTGKG